MGTASWRRLADALGVIGLVLTCVASLAPLLFESRPVRFVQPYKSPLTAAAIQGLVVLLGVLILWLRAWLDVRNDPARARTAFCVLVLLATALTACHEYAVGRHEISRGWQEFQYLAILSGEQITRSGAWSTVPHVFRPLPYGFTRSLELVTGDWPFACIVYRWFFTFWFVWAFYRFVRLYHDPVRSLLCVGVLAILYPASVWYYWGQLTDPLSHALYALALIYIVQDRRLELALALALGVLAKETAVVLVPGYFLCYWRGGVPALKRTAALGLVCMAAFLAARLPLGWGIRFDEINATRGLMVGTNLGIGRRLFSGGVAPAYQNYVQPLLFVGAFLPWIMAYWRRTDAKLKALFLTQVPLVLLSSLLFSWLYESRNYVPLLPILTSMAFPVRKATSA